MRAGISRDPYTLSSLDNFLGAKLKIILISSNFTFSFLHISKIILTFAPNHRLNVLNVRLARWLLYLGKMTSAEAAGVTLRV